MVDSYIVRIYRRDDADRSRAAGVVIDQQRGEVNNDAFNSAVELLRLLSLTAQRAETIDSAIDTTEQNKLIEQESR